MAIYSAETDGYKEACALVENLKAVGIESCIASGCVSIHCQPPQVNLAQKICKDSGAIFRTGRIGMAQELLFKSPDGRILLEKEKGNAKAIIEEWKD